MRLWVALLILLVIAALVVAIIEVRHRQAPATHPPPGTTGTAGMILPSIHPRALR